MYNTMLADMILVIEQDGCAVKLIPGDVGHFCIHRDSLEPFIKIPLGCSEIFSVIAGAHEYGHYRQYVDQAESDAQKFSNIVRDTSRILLEENAWERAVPFLIQFGFNDWESFIKEAAECMSTYYQVAHHIHEVIDKMHVFSREMHRYVRDLTKEVIYA